MVRAEEDGTLHRCFNGRADQAIRPMVVYLSTRSFLLLTMWPQTTAVAHVPSALFDTLAPWAKKTTKTSAALFESHTTPKPDAADNNDAGAAEDAETAP